MKQTTNLRTLIYTERLSSSAPQVSLSCYSHQKSGDQSRARKIFAMSSFYCDDQNIRQLETSTYIVAPCYLHSVSCSH